jgi:type I restriction enzyme S subunit
MMYEVPQSWQWVKLGELFDVQQGVAMSPNRRLGFSPYPFLRTLNVLWCHVDLSTLDKMDFTDEEVAKLSLKPGDLLVCEGGEVGRTAIWKGELEVCLYQNHIHRLRRLNDSVVPEFYMYWLQAAFQVFGSYGGQESKTTIPNLSGSRLKLFRVPLPPVEEQKRIAAKIQELMAEVKRARTACETQLETIKALPRTILGKTFRGEL